MPKKAQAETSETRDPIPLPEKAHKEVRAAFDQMRQIQAQLKAFLGGVRVSLDVPDGWDFDEKQMAFVPPEREDPQPDSTGPQA